MNRLSSSFLVCGAMAAALVACGGISDPTRTGENVATVRGALTGMSVPAGAKVALVFRKGEQGGYAVTHEAAIVDGEFTMTLSPPPDDFLMNVEGNDYERLNKGSEESVPPSVSGTGGGIGEGEDEATPTPTPTPTPSGREGRLAPRTNVSGGVHQPLSAAVAGFVVYVDANGNGKLDLEGPEASSPDTIVGGNDELLLAFFKGGGSLDYEKLRDKAGILPTAGYNLAWLNGRWLPLTLVELKLASSANLPRPVCETYSGYEASGAGSEPMPIEARPAPTDGGTSYPSPGDPNLRCSEDGRSFTYAYPSNCRPPPPRPRGLCSHDGPSANVCPPSGSYSTELADGQEVPEGWPCRVDSPPSIDAGTPSPGPSDAGVD